MKIKISDLANKDEVEGGKLLRKRKGVQAEKVPVYSNKTAKEPKSKRTNMVSAEKVTTVVTKAAHIEPTSLEPLSETCKYSCFYYIV